MPYLKDQTTTNYLAPILGTEYSDWPLYVYQYIRDGQIPVDFPEELRNRVTREAQNFIADEENELFRKTSSSDSSEAGIRQLSSN
jgi:hypothetical protein